ncbi:MAG TPA: single-stranded DNA-binding protein [Candidatus Nanoarchaeia archaeon]
MSARSLNKVMLIGNLTRDPELRYTPSGTAVCSFRVATNRSWTPADGSERKEETEFHRIVAWNKLAELCSQLLVKGRKVYIEGRLQTRSWETPEGDRRFATEVVAEDMVVLDSRRQSEEKAEGEVEEERPSNDVSEEAVGVAKEGVGAKEEKPTKALKKEAKQVDKEAKDESKPEPKEEEDKEIDVDDIPF